MDMLIQHEEMKGWFIKKPHCHDLLLKGYKESISDMTSSILDDPRSSKNTHIMNENFDKTPGYFMGFEAQDNRLFVISCLYVFPEFRGKGFGVELLNSAKSIVRDQGAIQVAVEESKLFSLDRFYKNNDFQTTGTLRKNSYGKGYVDYFWSGKQIKLIDYPEGTMVQPIN